MGKSVRKSAGTNKEVVAACIMQHARQQARKLPAQAGEQAGRQAGEKAARPCGCPQGMPQCNATTSRRWELTR